MSAKYSRYHEPVFNVNEENLGWNMYGAGEENIGKDGKPEPLGLPKPGPAQMLVRVDSVGLCFSDVKLIRMGGDHPKLYNRDLRKEPTRLGHEAALTIIEVGEELQGKYTPGQRVAVQPDIYQDGKSTAYGYTIPGGLIQYHLIGEEMLKTDEGECLLPVDDSMGYAESSLLEPWGCVLAAYTQRRRLEPKEGGVMWIIGREGDPTEYEFSNGLEAPAVIVLSNVPAAVAVLAEQAGAKTYVRNEITAQQFEALSGEFTNGNGFDDIVMLDPRSADLVGKVAKHVARRGTLNMVGKTALDGLVDTDVGRLHYDYVAFIGNQGPDIGASYGEARNRCELVAKGTTVFIGAGGPMGQMHVQRALELPDGPSLVIATEVSDERLQSIQDRYESLAERNGRKLFCFNPQNSENKTLHDFVMEITNGKGADDVVVSVPIAPVMAEGDTLMNEDGMLVFFAGVPNGTMAPMNLSNVYLNNAQYTGTSGLTLDDQRQVLSQASAGALSPGISVGAIGGMNVARDGIQAVVDGKYAGKIVIFPHLEELPLLGLNELAEELPEVAEKLGPGNMWTKEAEEALFEKYWKG